MKWCIIYFLALAAIMSAASSCKKNTSSSINERPLDSDELLRELSGDWESRETRAHLKFNGESKIVSISNLSLRVSGLEFSGIASYDVENYGDTDTPSVLMFSESITEGIVMKFSAEGRNLFLDYAIDPGVDRYVRFRKIGSPPEQR